jgi:hypothetical protein
MIVNLRVLYGLTMHGEQLALESAFSCAVELMSFAKLVRSLLFMCLKNIIMDRFFKNSAVV